MAQLKIAVLVFLMGLCLSTTALTAFAQTSLETKFACDKPSEAVQITFDHVETLVVVNGRPTNVYWLKLRNNSNCGVELEVPEEFIRRTFPSPRIARNKNGQFIKNANGGLLIERLAKPEFNNGDKVKIIYNLADSGLNSIGTGNYEGCVVQSITLRTGQEFLFPIDSPAFKKNHSVEVMFGVVGEKPIPNQPPLRHKATFAFNNIPQNK